MCSNYTAKMSSRTNDSPFPWLVPHPKNFAVTSRSFVTKHLGFALLTQMLWAHALSPPAVAPVAHRIGFQPGSGRKSLARLPEEIGW